MNVIKYICYGLISLAILAFLVIGIKWIIGHPEVLDFRPNYKPYKDSIDLLKKDIAILHIKNDSLSNAIDTVIINKGRIQIQYRSVYKYINGYSSNQLDSAIKANIKE